MRHINYIGNEKKCYNSSIKHRIIKFRSLKPEQQAVAHLDHDLFFLKQETQTGMRNVARAGLQINSNKPKKTQKLNLRTLRERDRIEKETGGNLQLGPLEGIPATRALHLEGLRGFP